MCQSCRAVYQARDLYDAVDRLLAVSYIRIGAEATSLIQVEMDEVQAAQMELVRVLQNWKPCDK